MCINTTLIGLSNTNNNNNVSKETVFFDNQLRFFGAYGVIDMKLK